MSDELDRILERARQNRQAREETVSRGGAAVASRPVVSGSTLRAGDRVFDLVSGREGAIAEGHAGVVDGGAVVYVFLDGGTGRMRRVDQLVPRPTTPAVK